MDVVFLGRLTGWLVAGLAVNTVVIALFRKHRLQDHYVSGYAIASLSLLHASLSINGVGPGLAEEIGIIVATAGMVVSWGQVMLGRRVRATAPEQRGGIRLLHGSVALLLAFLLVAHLGLNGRFLRGG